MKYPIINTRETPSLFPGFLDSWPHVIILGIVGLGLYLHEPKDPPPGPHQDAEPMEYGGRQ